MKYEVHASMEFDWTFVVEADSEAEAIENIDTSSEEFVALSDCKLQHVYNVDRHDE